MQNNEKESRITLRLESVQKNKNLSGLARKNGENYQDIFTSVYNAILGEYFITKFNKIYNPAPDSNHPLKSKKNCVLDYLNSQSLSHYLDCAQEVIEDVMANGCTIKQALRKITPKAKIIFSDLSINDLCSSIEKDVKKRQKQIKKSMIANGMVKNTTITKTMQIPETTKELSFSQMPSAEQFQLWEEEFKKTKEYQDYLFEERDMD